MLKKSKRDPDIIRRDRMCDVHERNFLISRHEKENTRSKFCRSAENGPRRDWRNPSMTKKADVAFRRKLF